jgi:hypothetical protein
LSNENPQTPEIPGEMLKPFVPNPHTPVSHETHRVENATDADGTASKSNSRKLDRKAAARLFHERMERERQALGPRVKSAANRPLRWKTRAKTARKQALNVLTKNAGLREARAKKAGRNAPREAWSKATEKKAFRKAKAKKAIDDALFDHTVERKPIFTRHAHQRIHEGRTGKYVCKRGFGRRRNCFHVVTVLPLRQGWSHAHKIPRIKMVRKFCVENKIKTEISLLKNLSSTENACLRTVSRWNAWQLLKKRKHGKIIQNNKLLMVQPGGA